jgi:ADP-heptose:LPS heptosyltransferase
LMPTTVVGLSAARDIAPWPSSVELRLDLGGSELVNLIASARACIGSATGLSHIAAELQRPTLFLWANNNSDIYMPVRNETAMHLSTQGLSDHEILSAVDRFLSTQFAAAPYSRPACVRGAPDTSRAA